MPDRDWVSRFEDRARRLIEQGAIPAVAVGLADQREVVYTAGFGSRDADGRLPVTSDTRFGLGSVTKSFPALSIAQLEEAGRLSIHDPVRRWLPEYRLPAVNDPSWAEQTTIHHFLTHSAGIPPEPSLLHARAASICADPDLARQHPKPLGIPDPRALEQIETYEELMSLMARQSWRALGPPGRVLSYCNEGYVLLAAIVERASGQSFPEYLQEHVLDPLGMKRTGLYTRHTPPMEPEIVPYAVDNRGGKREAFRSPAWWDQGKMFGNGGLKSDVDDLLRYLEIYRTGGESRGARVLSAAGIAKMTAPQQPIATGGHYGYGLQVNDVPGIGRVVGHGGGNKGVATHMLVVPERGLTAVVLTNLANQPAAKIAQAAVNAYLGRPADEPWATYPETKADPAAMERFVGTYAGQPPITLEVAVKDGVLQLTTQDGTFAARPYADDAFYLPALDQPIRVLEEDGRVWAMGMGLRTHARIN